MDIRGLIIALALLMAGAGAFSQEWVDVMESYTTDDEVLENGRLYPTVSGDILIHACKYYKCGYGDFYAPNAAVRRLSQDGEVIAEKVFFKEAYYCPSHYVFEDSNGNPYLMAAYTPNHDPTDSNYFLNYDNPPDEAILGLYRLNDSLEAVGTYEHRFKIDTFEWRDHPNFGIWPLSYPGTLGLLMPLVEDDHIVGGYVKSVSMKEEYTADDNDSLFMFKMDFNGNFLERKGYKLPENWGSGYYGSVFKHGSGYQIFFNKSIEYEHIPYPDVIYLDEDLDTLRARRLAKADVLEQRDAYNFVSRNIVKSPNNTFYLSTELNIPSKVRGGMGEAPHAGADTAFGRGLPRQEYADRAWSLNDGKEYLLENTCVRLYEYDDDIEGTELIIPAVRYITRGLENGILDRASGGVDVFYDNSICFAYTLNVGFWELSESYIVIERLNSDLDTISTLFYVHEGNRMHTRGSKVKLTREQDVILTYWVKDLDNLKRRMNCVAKFPAEVFLGIDEAHESGLRVAVAYPNPGGGSLNIRTGLRNSQVRVCDVSGRTVYLGDIEGQVMSIDASSWPSGTYIWTVTSNGREAESGTWIRE